MSVSSKPARPAIRPAGSGTVSLTSAQRFAARARARRLYRLMLLAAGLLLAAAAGWLVLKSPWGTVRSIEVTGTRRVSASAVRAAAEPELGHPLVSARTAQVAALVARQPLVRSVRVERHFPSGLRIRVVEREPAAALPDGGQFDLVDGDGVLIYTATSVPAGIPRIQVDLDIGGVEALRGCLTVLHGLPPALSHQVQSIAADSPDGIRLTLKGGALVLWGSPTDTPLKAEVLTALLPQHAASYDVRSPDTPALREK